MVPSTPAAEPTLTLLVCTYNRADDLADLLRTALSQQTDGTFTYEILVVDNTSVDGTSLVVEELVARGHTNLRYLFEPRQGKSHALNTGLEAIRTPLYTNADDDFVLPSEWVQRIVDVFRARPDVSFVSGKVLPLWQATVPSWLNRDHWSAVALADYGTVPMNEYYASQYVDYTPLPNTSSGVALAIRQNLSIGGRDPWALIGSLARGAQFGFSLIRLRGEQFE